MAKAHPGLHDTFDISDWRSNVKARREYLRSIVHQATVEGEDLEPMIEQMKRALGAWRMDDADRNLLHVTIHDLRTIVGGWSLLSTEEQNRFLGGKGAPSSVAGQIRKLRD